MVNIVALGTESCRAMTHFAEQDVLRCVVGCQWLVLVIFCCYFCLLRAYECTMNGMALQNWQGCGAGGAGYGVGEIHWQQDWKIAGTLTQVTHHSNQEWLLWSF